MVCPKCGEAIPEGKLYCEKCGEEIQIVPEYDPILDIQLGQEEGTLKKSPQRVAASPKKEKTPLNSRKKGKKAVYLLYAFLVLLVITVIALSYVTQRNVKRTQSLDYQISQAEKYQSLGEYSKATECYARAVELDAGNVELLEKLANLYFLQNDQAWHEAILRKIIGHENASDLQRRKASEELITLLVKKGRFDEISKLIKTSKDEVLYDSYREYLSQAPEFSLEEGTYEDMQYLQIASTSEFDGKIYYTLDGSTPGENGTLYSLPIILEPGKTVVRACFINEFGVKSDIITGTYVIENEGVAE